MKPSVRFAVAAVPVALMATASLATGMAANAGAVAQRDIRYPVIGIDGAGGNGGNGGNGGAGAPAWIDVTVSSETTGVDEGRTLAR